MNGTRFTGTRDTIFTLIGKEVIKILIKEFHGRRYESTKHGSIIEIHSGNMDDSRWNI
jgi:hypothetical protein